MACIYCNSTSKERKDKRGYLRHSLTAKLYKASKERKLPFSRLSTLAYRHLCPSAMNYLSVQIALILLGTFILLLRQELVFVKKSRVTVTYHQTKDGALLQSKLQGR